jgi:hypothetical protein
MNSVMNSPNSRTDWEFLDWLSEHWLPKKNSTLWNYLNSQWRCFCLNFFPVILSSISSCSFHPVTSFVDRARPRYYVGPRSSCKEGLWRGHHIGVQRADWTMITVTGDEALLHLLCCCEWRGPTGPNFPLPLQPHGQCAKRNVGVLLHACAL